MRIWNGTRKVLNEKYRLSFPQIIAENGISCVSARRDSILFDSPIHRKDISEKSSEVLSVFFCMYWIRLRSGKTCQPVPPHTRISVL